MSELVALNRKKIGEDELPSYSLIDSQSVKTIAAAANYRVIDGKKK